MHKLLDDDTAAKTMYLPNKKLAVNKYGQKLVEGLIKKNVDQNKYDKRVLDSKDQHLKNLEQGKNKEDQIANFNSRTKSEYIT